MDPSELIRVVAAVTALTVTGGCQVIGGFSEYEVVDPATTSAGGTGGTGGAGGVGGEGGQGGEGGEGGEGGQGGEGGTVEPCGATRLYVDATATGAGDGSTWTDAFPELHAAMALTETCSGITQIWVAAGEYLPGATASEAITLQSGLAIFGGFAGGEALLEERDPATQITILSGDLNDDDIKVNGVLTTPSGIVGTNSLHVVRADGVDATAVLDGFVITGGSAEGAEDDGGGIAAGDGSPTLVNLLVQGNVAQDAGGGLHGTGEPTLDNVVFTKNAAVRGGAIAMTGGKLTLTAAQLLDNDASNDGGAVALSDGAGSDLRRVDLRGNEAGIFGGAISVADGTHQLHNCALGGNHANVQSGGAWYVTGATFTATNVTVVGNRATLGGGAYHTGMANVAIFNSILFNNASMTETGTLGANLVNVDAAPTIAFSLVEGSGAGAMWDPAAGTDGGDNLDADPKMRSPTDPQLAPTVDIDLVNAPISPGVDAGDATVVVDTVSDLAGNPRLGYQTVDLGAYEIDAPCNSSIVRVDAAATGLNDGTTWTDAFVDLQRAIAHFQHCAGVTQIWVAEGVYNPGWSVYDSFQMHDGLALYGGFDGTETQLHERDLAENNSVLSGDIDGDDQVNADGVAVTFNGIVGVNNYHVVNGNYVGSTARLDGFTITSGNAVGSNVWENGGAGIFIGSGSPVLETLWIVGNYADGDGGGAFAWGATQVQINNTVFWNNHGSNGGGLRVYSTDNTSLPVLNTVTFLDNVAEFDGGGAYFRNADITWTGGAVEGNQAIYFLDSQGGGIYVRDCGGTISDLMIRGNHSENTGGGYATKNGGVRLQQSVIAGNQAMGIGGGIWQSGGGPQIVNVTIAGNIAWRGGGIGTDSGGGGFQVANSVIWGNAKVSGVNVPSQESVHNTNPGTNTWFWYSLVEHCGGSGAGWEPLIGNDSGSNVDADPLFVLPQTPMLTIVGDYHIQAGSAATDIGNSNFMTSVPQDFDGNARVQGPSIDAGAYELTP